PVVEVMTEKVTVEIPAPVSGTILKVMAKAGEIVNVGQTLFVIGQKGEPVQNIQAQTEAKVAVVQSSMQRPKQVAKAGVLATPAVRRLAREMNVDLALVEGTGSGGRITEADVRRLNQKAAIVQSTATYQAAETGLEERIPLRGIRKTIADRMAKSKNTAADVTHVEEVDMTELVSLREKTKVIAAKSGVKLTYLPFVVKAVVSALKKYNLVNSSLDDEKSEIVVKKYYNIGIAVATENGLIVPVIKDADNKGLLQIAREIEDLSEKARTNKLTLNEVKGGTFTVTNIGSVGGIFSTAIINYPEVAILALGRIAKRPAVKDGQIAVRDTANLALTFDHRVLDGADAANFLNAIKHSLETPSLLMLEGALSQV
ncbi:MAG: 2-oxo acid dehydrogenase subunit E2, partial [Thaumarchaeota archaeon]|nr:2-oxo acid dehydrogenase subunit E2 [Nitrososphaerota archaeon]